MTISQEITLLNQDDKSYDDTVTVTDVPNGYFLAEISDEYNNPPTREITFQMMALQQAQGGTQTVGTGLFVRQDGETAVKVIVQDDSGKQVAENTTNYPS